MDCQYDDSDDYPAVYSLAISGVNIFAGTQGGIYLSTDNGASWNAMDNGMNTSEVTSLVISETNIFAGTYEKGVYLSTNNGVSWNAVNNGLANIHIVFISYKRTIYFLRNKRRRGIFLSTDNRRKLECQ